MPELPEVESFARHLDAQFSGGKIKEITFHRKDIRYPLNIPKLKQIFANNAVLTKIQRVGKQLFLETTAGNVYVGLGMTGSFVIAEPQKPTKHQHITVTFHNRKTMGFVDPRRFGFWSLTASKNLLSAADPLDSQQLLKCFNDHRNSKKNIKAFLLDQNHIGGLGNIYVLEALFASKIHPLATCDQIPLTKYQTLARAIPDILTAAIRAGGSSISTYKQLKGEQGSYQDAHKVYGQEGQHCTRNRCSGQIQRIAQLGRSSWFCPTCQKM